MKIKYTELNKAYQILMHALEEGIIGPLDQMSSSGETADKEISFSSDYYWNVPIGERHNLNSEPKLDMGSIDHDIERILQLNDGDYPIHHHLRWLGDILIAISDELGGYANKE